MNTFLRIVVASFSFFCWISPSYAMLDLELTKGVASAVPIAVVPFQLTGAKPSTDVSEIVMKDLANSGEFRPLDKAEMKSFPSEVGAVNFNEWRDKKMNYLVIGKVAYSGSGKVTVTFSLLDVYKGESSVSESLLVTKSFEVKEENLRTLAHRIANMIYEQITGVKGVFLTQLAYVLVRHTSDSVRYDLVISDADGYNPQSILSSEEPIMSPAWSPDGRKIAYVSLEGKKAAIYVSEVSSGRRQLISQLRGINGAPAWSPDGKRLAIVLSQGGGTNIYTVDAGGGNQTPVTHGFSIDTEPEWMPDGKSLLFTSDRGGSPQIYRADLTTGDIKRLTYNSDYNASASLTPDGNSIVILHRENGQYGIAIQDLSSGVLTTLSRSGYDQHPSVSPNGKMIIYASQPGQKSILNFISVDGRVKLTLPETSGEVREPAWGPFVGE